MKRSPVIILAVLLGLAGLVCAVLALVLPGAGKPLLIAAIACIVVSTVCNIVSALRLALKKKK